MMSGSDTCINYFRSNNNNKNSNNKTNTEIIMVISAVVDTKISNVQLGWLGSMQNIDFSLIDNH